MRRVFCWLGRGIRQDFRQRWPLYVDDWRLPQNGRLRVLAASVFIFCASAIPALAFGVQLYADTGGLLSAVHVLSATAFTGVAQALLGGQPLLIVGVAEPIVLTYKFMFDFAKDQEGLGPDLFLPWCAWTCVWASLMILLLSLLNSCAYISRFTRLAGELFGALIALLFMQQAVKGLVEEFREVPEGASPAEASTAALANGLWSLFLAWGVLLTSLLLRQARSWRFLRPALRSFLADYGTTLMLLAFSGLSFAVHGVSGLPRRVQSPNTWDVRSSWTVAGDMGRVGGVWIAAALVPALLITILFFFDHNVSAQLAQQAEFNLKKPSAYHYDLMLLGLMTLACGLLGLPPVNGVLPQSPLHTKALAAVKSSRPRGGKRAVAPAEAGKDGRDGLGGGGDAPCHAPLAAAAVEAPPPSIANGQMHPSASRQALIPSAAQAAIPSPPLPTPTPTSAVPGGAASAPAGAAVGSGVDGSGGRVCEDSVVSVEVAEQRLSGLLQSMGVGACLAAMPAIRQIPTAVLWGYFAFMAVESLPGSQLWDRLLLLLTDPQRRPQLLEKGHAPYYETVPFRTIAWFTGFQLAYLLAVYGVTWAGVAGILFPVPIMLLVPLRHWVMPRCFSHPWHLQELDAAEEEEAAPLSHEQAMQEAATQGLGAADTSSRGGGGGSGGEDGAPTDLESEIHRLRMVHHISRESLIQRRHTLELSESEAAAVEMARSAPSAAVTRLPGMPGSPGARMRRRSQELQV